MTAVRIPAGIGTFVFVIASRPALRPTEWVLGALYLPVNVKVATHVHLVPRIGMRGSILHLPHTPS